MNPSNSYYTIKAAAQELDTSEMIIRLALIVNGQWGHRDLISESVLDIIRVTVHRMKEAQG